MTQTPRPPTGPNEFQDFLFTGLMGSLRRDNKAQQVFEVLERRNYLARQVDYLQSFAVGARDLQDHVLGAALALGDWQRLLRYSLVAVNFREVAAILAEEPILRNLAAQGGAQLAKNLADQLEDPAARARARAELLEAVIPEAADSVPDRGELLRQILDDLAEIPDPVTAAAADVWLQVLRSLAEHLALPTLTLHWASWVRRLDRLEDAQSAPRRIQEAWQVLVERWLETPEVLPGPDLWPALAALRQAAAASHVQELARDPLALDPVLARLPQRLAAAGWLAETLLSEPLAEPLAGDEPFLWHLRLALQGLRLNRGQIGSAEAAAWVEEIPISWTVELVAAGQTLWGQLGAGRVGAIAARRSDPRIATAILTVSVEESRSPESCPAALAALEVLADGAWQVHWTLRLLAAQPAAVGPQGQARLERYLRFVRYGVRPADLARFLNLPGVAADSRLRQRLEEIVWSPQGTTETLRVLADQVTHPTTLTLLLDEAETWAATVASNEAEGFDLRRDLLIRTASRLCGLLGQASLVKLAAAADRLLPEEAVQLWLAAVDAVVAAAGQADLAAPNSRLELCQTICAQIDSPRHRLLAELRAGLPVTLDAATLYQAVASSRLAEDERHALRPLLEANVNPAAAPAAGLEQIAVPVRRFQACLDLAWHSLAMQQGRLPAGQIDHTAAVQPVANGGAGLAAEELVRLTPAVVALATRESPRRAVREVQEAVRRVLELDEVDEEMRLMVVELMITRLDPWLLGAGDRQLTPRRCRLVARLFEWLAALPAVRGTSLLPGLVGSSRRLPGLVQAYLWHPWRSRLLAEWLGWLSPAVAAQRLWRWLESVDRWLPTGRRSSPWSGGVRTWPVTADLAERDAFEAVLRRDDEVLQRLLSAAGEGTVVERLETLCLLGGAVVPAEVCRLIGKMPAGERRDRFCLRLIRGRFLDEVAADEVAAWIAEDARRQEARLWNAVLYGDDPAVLEALARLLENGGHPSQVPLGRWPDVFARLDREVAGRRLAQAMIGALRRGGRRLAEEAVGLWLSAWLLCQPQTEESFSRVDTTAQQARSLGDPPPAALAEL